MLVDAVASANRCRSVLADGWGYTTVVGDQADLEMVELLTTSLLLQGTRAMLSTGSQHGRGGVSRTRSYRQSFLAATDARKLLPVLSERSRAVDDLTEQQFPQLIPKGISVSNAAGWGAGLAAADLALFDVHQALGQPERLYEPERQAG